MTRTDPEDEQEIFSLSNVQALSVPIWVYDIDFSRFIWANSAALALWEASSLEELCARDMRAEITQVYAQKLMQYQQAFVETAQTFHEFWTQYPRSNPQRHRIALKGHRLPDGRMGVLCEAMSIRKQTPESIRCAEAINHISVCVSLFNDSGVALYSNSAADAVYGDVSPSLADRFAEHEDYQQLQSMILRDGTAKLTCEVKAKKSKRWHEMSAHSRFDEATNTTSIILSEVDVTALKEQQQKVRYLAHQDLLTGLYNRNFVNLGFPKLLQKTQTTDTKLAMILMDLDNFKTINDTLGHIAGDQLLVHVSSLLKAKIGELGHVARMGGDEFVILLPYDTQEEIDALCEAILAEISSDCQIGDHLLHSKASLGISLCPEHGQDLEALMQHADLALYEAKDNGRNTFRYFRPALQRAALIQRNLEKDLIKAIELDQFRLYYQPRVDCQSQAILSVEALMRWHHPERGIVGPGVFIETLEETGLIHQVGDWIVEQAGKDQCILAQQGHDIPISINISPKQFERPDFVKRLTSSLARSKCQASRIEIEITESMLMGEGYDAKSVLQQLRKYGFSIAVDDFGTGYSNLSYIQGYPISSLKVDRSFIQMIEDQSSVVNLILSLCRLVGVTAVAEGVETIDQLAWLQLNHCNQYQGYLYSKPIPFDQLIALFSNPPQLSIAEHMSDTEEPEIAWA